MKGSVNVSRFLLTLAYPERTGSPKMAYHFAAALRQAGHSVSVAHGPGPKPTAEGDASILPALRSVEANTRLIPGLARPVSPRVSREVARWGSEQGVDAVIGFQQRDRAVALAAARQLGVPGVISAQNQHRFWGRWPLPWIKELVYGRALRHLAKLVVCTSPVVQREVVQRFGVAKGRTCVLPNGIDVAGFPHGGHEGAASIRREFGVEDDRPLAISVGRIDIQKAYDVLLEAVRRLPQSTPSWKLVIVGGVSQGPNQERMEQYHRDLRSFIQQHQLADIIHFAGWRDDIPQILQAADLYVHPARWEGWPLALVEAMAAELSTVTTDCSGRPEKFEDGVHGYVVPKEDPDALAGALSKVLALSPNERRRQGAAARALALAHYDLQPIGKRFVDLMESVLHQHQ